jgi:hypothetical protein
LDRAAGDRLKPAFREALDSVIQHLDRRCNLPSARLARLGPIARELVSGRYRRFSRGALSAAKDLIR